VEDVGTMRSRFHLSICVCCVWALSAAAQISNPPELPSQFKLDMETASRLKPKLMAQSVAAVGRYATGRLVFERLVQQVEPASSVKFTWQLRVVENNELNAYSSPDGSIYVESGLAKMAGPSAGLWAAILSHEIAHVVRRDWAQRYLYQNALETRGGQNIVLGDPGVPQAMWSNSEKASADFGRFCRQMELEADREGLMLMVRAGYHPDFVPALHHLLHARSGGPRNASLYAMHPCWEERDRELVGAYRQASIEFEHRWPEWYASPGGNPPVVVFADSPLVKKSRSKEWEIRLPMHCQNLVGAVEVVLRADPGENQIIRPVELSENEDRDYEVRQLTGCTSPQTTVVFTLADLAAGHKPGTRWTDVYVVDASGSVLTRADLPKLPH
jgi:Peptidase family M48